MATTGNAELDGFVAEYTHEIAALTNALFDPAEGAYLGCHDPCLQLLNRARHWLGALRSDISRRAIAGGLSSLG